MMKRALVQGFGVSFLFAACSSSGTQVQSTATASTEAQGMCEHGPGEGHGHGPGAEHGHATASAPAPQELPGGARLFGAALDGAMSETALSAILAAPEQFRDQNVKTSGVIAQVCQRMGCWMELRAADGGPAIRVPMAGHSFFLPRDVAGRPSTVQGRVKVQALTDAQREHLRAEGAQALDQAILIEATGVVVE